MDRGHDVVGPVAGVLGILLLIVILAAVSEP
jgi:hypothetical protein